jgi:hypothetical protein
MHARPWFAIGFFALLLSGCGSSTTAPSSNQNAEAPTGGKGQPSGTVKDADGKDAGTTSDPVDAFKKAGGTVIFERGKVEGLRLAGPSGNATTMKMLEKFPEATRLELFGVAAKGADFEVLRKLPNLTILTMNRCAVDDDTLKIVGELTKLSTLHLRQTGVTTKGLSHLRKLKHLSVVSLEKTKLHGSTLEVFADKPKLQVLFLTGTGIENEALASLSKLPILHSLGLKDCKKISDEGLVHLHSVKTLLTLDVQGTSVTDKGIEGLKKAVPSVRVRK